MTDNAQLAACPNPWCESHEHGAVPHAPEDLWNIEGNNATRVQCPSCYMVGPHRMTEAEAIAAWNQRTALTQAPRSCCADVDMLTEFGKHANWELSHTFMDDEEAWQVHAVNGGRNDREWTLIGTGDTPAEAIATAIRSNSHDG